MIKSSAITNRLSIRMAGPIIDYLFSPDKPALADYNSFLSPLEFLQIAQEKQIFGNILGICFSHFILTMCLVYTR